MAQYDDEDFLECIPMDPSQTRGTHQIADQLGCTWQTVNRRLTEIAEEHDVLEVYDPDEDEYLDEQTTTNRILAYSASREFLEEHGHLPNDE